MTDQQFRWRRDLFLYDEKTVRLRAQNYRILMECKYYGMDALGIQD
jgi:hypothetical protein